MNLDPVTTACRAVAAMPPTLDRGTSRAAIDDIPVLKKEEVYVSKSSAFGFDKKGQDLFYRTE